MEHEEFQEKVLDHLIRLTQSNTEIKDRLEIVEDKLANGEVHMESIKDRFGDFANRMGNVEDRLGNLENHMGTVEDRLGKLENRMESVEDRLGNLDNQVRDVKDRVGNLDNQVGDVKDRLETLETTVLRMENDHGEKLQALIDAREVQLDVNERIIGALNRIEGKVDLLSLKVSAHDAIVKKVK